MDTLRLFKELCLEAKGGWRVEGREEKGRWRVEGREGKSGGRVGKGDEGKWEGGGVGLL